MLKPVYVPHRIRYYSVDSIEVCEKNNCISSSVTVLQLIFNCNTVVLTFNTVI